MTPLPSKTFAERLKAGDTLLAASVGLSPTVAEILGDCGFDWLFIDAEYLPLTLPDIQHIILAARATPAEPVVRLNHGQAADIRQVLDMGAAGVIVPQVKTPDQARAAVAAAKYAPLGERGLSAGRAQAYGAGTGDYIARANDETAIIVMIEDRQGLEQAEEIAAVEGLDGIFVGSGDLCMSLGYPGEPMHPELQAAYQHIAAAAQQNHVALGAYPTSREMYEFCAAQGFKFFLCALDAGLLRQAATTRLKEMSRWK